MSLPAPTDDVSPHKITVSSADKGTPKDSATGTGQRNLGTAALAPERGSIDSETQMPSASDGGVSLGELKAEIVDARNRIVEVSVSQGLKGSDSQQRTKGRSKIPAKLDKGQQSMQSFFAKKSSQ